ESVLSEVGRIVHKPVSAANITMDFADEQPLRHWCDVNSAELDSIDYGASVCARVLVPEDQSEAFSAFCDAHKLDYSFET
ncbi:MAG: DUF1949 domain-containing protein, partial [Marinobacter sp.]